MPTTTSWLAGTTVAVTGAGCALGRAVAASLASHRISLVLAGEDTQTLGETAYEVTRVRTLHQNTDAPLVVEADTTTPEGVETLQSKAVATYGPLDALVQVVEIGDAALLASATAAVLTMAGRGLIRQGGALVLVVLAGPWRSPERSAALAETTAALDGVVRGAARALHSRVAVNGVMLEARARKGRRALGFESLSRPMFSARTAPQTAAFDEAARIVRFLASREAQALTGHTLTVGTPLAEAA